VFIWLSARTCINICICTVFLKKMVFNVERKKARLLIYVTASMYLYSPCMINLSPPFEQWIGHMISFLN
jgi:hypothetical protein